MKNNFNEQLVAYFKEFSNENSDDFNVFKNHITVLLNKNIKPVSTVSVTNKKDNTWRNEQKQKFSCIIL